MPGSLRSLLFAVNLSAFALALAAACDGGGDLDSPIGSSGAAGSSNAGQGGTSSGAGGGAQQGAGGSGTAGNAGSGASGGGASSGASGSGGNAGNSAGGTAGGGAAGVAGNGGGSAGAAGNGGGSAGAAGGAGLCPPADIGPAPKCGQTPPPGLEACANCLCANTACRTAYEACTARPGCALIAACVFQCAAAGAAEGAEACLSQGNFLDQLAAGAVLDNCEAPCENECLVGPPP